MSDHILHQQTQNTIHPILQSKYEGKDVYYCAFLSGYYSQLIFNPFVYGTEEYKHWTEEYELGIDAYLNSKVMKYKQ